MAASELDQLVDTIAARVRARLGGALPVVESAHGCDDDPSHCSGCGHCVSRRPHAARAIAGEGAARIGAGPDTGPVDSSLAGLIDHTLLKADATTDEVRKLCDEARKYHFASVCVNSGNVARARSLLAGSGVMTCAVVGFPLGAMATSAKAFEAREAVRAGADEIDMVINVGALKSRDYALVSDDIRKVVEASRPARVKVILETGMLTNEEKVIAISLAKVAGAHFVKTSTGFGPGGATTDDIALMRRLVGAELGVKASGGVRTHEDAEKMVAAGASRIGASASIAIVTNVKLPTQGAGKPEKKRAGGY